MQREMQRDSVVGGQFHHPRSTRHRTLPNCGGASKIIAAIEDPPVIVKILSHLGLPTRAPPRALALRVDLFQII